MEQVDLKGRVAVVTGSSGAVGTAVSTHLRVRGAFVMGVRSGKAERADEIMADLSDETEVKRVFDEVERRFGKVEIVVHTVGGFAAGGRLTETTLETWENMQRVNVRTSFLCLRESLRRMARSPYGRVILFGAATGLLLPTGRAAYGVAKASVHHLTEVASKEVNGTGITVNAIAPFTIDTPANRSWSDPDPATWVSVEEICRVIEGWCDTGSKENGTILRLPRSS